MKLKKLLSFAAATAMAVTSLTSAMTFTASAADMNGTITITAGYSYRKPSVDIPISGAGNYTATVEGLNGEYSLEELGFFTYSPYPTGNVPFTIDVTSLTFIGKIDGSGDTIEFTCTDLKDSKGLVPAETIATETGKNPASLPRVNQYDEGTVCGTAIHDGTTYYILYVYGSFSTIDTNDFNTGQHMLMLDSITYNFTVKSGAAETNYTKLQEAVDNAKKTYTAGPYTAESYKSLSDAVSAGEALISGNTAAQADVDKAVEAIKTAINGLVYKNVSLNQTIKDTKKAYVDGYGIRDKYTISTYNALTSAITAGEEIAANTESTQDAINAAEQAIKDAVSGLKFRSDEEHKAKLIEAQTKYRNIFDTEYTSESYAPFKELVDNKLVPMEANDATNEEIDQVIAEAEAAYNALVKKSLEFKPLEEALAKAKEITDKAESAVNYTEKSYAELLEAIEKGKKVLKNEDGTVTNTDIHNAESRITDCINKLEYKPADYKKVDEALAKVPTDLTLYTDETAKAVNEAVKAVVRDKNITEQKVVDSYVKPIEDAVAALVFKPADYTKVDEAIAKIPTDLSKYTDESVKALNTAKEAVIRDKNISEQATVDGYAKAIEDAISALKVKSAPTKPNPTKPTVNTPAKATTKATRSKDAVKKDKSAAKKAMKQAKITKLKVKSKAKKKINVTWKKVKKAKGYQVQVSAKKNFKKVIFKKDLKKTKLTIKNKKIKSKKTYYVRVRAYATYKNANNKVVKVYSKWNKKLRKVTVK